MGSVCLNNDDFACRTLLVGTNITFVASTVGATREAGETQHSFFGGPSHSVWYTWTAQLSGGVVLQGQGTFPGVVLAVYTSNTLATLQHVVDDMSGFGQARLAFTATAGQVYQIVVDGVQVDSSSDGEGNVTVTLINSPAPSNDLFTNATPIPGNYYVTSGSFVGGSWEPGEPSYCSPSFPPTESLWWTWTAPTNAGVSNSLVTITADAVMNFPPMIGVYTGSSISNLTAVLACQPTNVPVNNAVYVSGLTSIASFIATAGTTYHIVLAGTQWASDARNVISPQFGNYRFRFNNRALALTLASPPPDGDAYNANLRIDNLSPTNAGPLRISLLTVSGGSLKGPDTNGSLNVSTFYQTNWPGEFTLGAGQGTNVQVTGTNPPPTTTTNAVNPSNSDLEMVVGTGYGVYAQLQELRGGATWATVDQVLVHFGNWPEVGGNNGVGGGVVRLDPDSGSLSGFDPVTSFLVLGSTSLVGGTTASYTGMVAYAQGDTQSFTTTAWSSSLAGFIDTNGVLSAPKVTSNTVVTLSAPFYSGGLLYTATTNVTIYPYLLKFTGLTKLANGGLALTLSGLPGRTNIIEATTNFSPTFWVPLATNASPSGIWTFTNFAVSNVSRSFYRGRQR